MPREIMRLQFVVTVFCITVLSGFEAHGQVNVTQEHNNPSRDGVYIDAAFTLSAAANITRDLNFDGTISGNVYAQPLYIDGGPKGAYNHRSHRIKQCLCAQCRHRDGDLAAERRYTSSIEPSRVR